MIERTDIEEPVQVVDPVHIRSALARRVSQVLTKSNGSGPRIARVVLPVGRVNLFAWLQAQGIPSKLYWSGRYGDVEVAAVGVADVCRHSSAADLEALRRHLTPVLAASDSQVRYYGGMRFDPTQAPEGVWAAFGTYRFVLPRFEVRLHSGRAVLVCNLLLPRDHARREEILAQVGRLQMPADELPRAVPMPISRQDRPDMQGWRRNIEWALSAFATRRLDKVVFGREASFGFMESLDPVALLENLKAGTPNCFHFYVQPEPGIAFVGATPERLFRCRGRTIDSEAVAGTRPRGASATDDARLLEELLHSDKDLREHEFVRVSMLERLEAQSEHVYLDPQPSEMKLASGRHLVSRIRASLHDGVTSLDVLTALHPTPAVGGYPRDDALAAIRAREPFDRGWYAGPVGWIGPDAAEFAVGIRSGLVEPHRLSLYSGAGIVAGSTPEDEWEEVEYKIGDFIKVLRLDVQRTVVNGT